MRHLVQYDAFKKIIRQGIVIRLVDLYPRDGWQTGLEATIEYACRGGSRKKGTELHLNPQVVHNLAANRIIREAVFDDALPAFFRCIK